MQLANTFLNTARLRMMNTFTNSGNRINVHVVLSQLSRRPVTRQGNLPNSNITRDGRLRRFVDLRFGQDLVIVETGRFMSLIQVMEGLFGPVVNRR